MYCSFFSDEFFDFVEDAKGFFSSKSNGKIRLVDQRNYTYGVNRKDFNNKIFWNCTNYQCKARAVTVRNKITKLSGEHFHQSNYHGDYKLDQLY